MAVTIFQRIADLQTVRTANGTAFLFDGHVIELTSALPRDKLNELAEAIFTKILHAVSEAEADQQGVQLIGGFSTRCGQQASAFDYMSRNALAGVASRKKALAPNGEEDTPGVPPPPPKPRDRRKAVTPHS